MATDGSIHKLSYPKQAQIIAGKFKLGDTKLSIKYSLSGVADREYHRYVSQKAYKRLSDDNEGRRLLSNNGIQYRGSYAKRWGLRIEHMIPVEVVYDYVKRMHDKGKLTEKFLARLIKKRLFCAIITKEEDCELNKAGLRKKMPEQDWDILNGNILARYDAIGLRMHVFS